MLMLPYMGMLFFALITAAAFGQFSDPDVEKAMYESELGRSDKAVEQITQAIEVRPAATHLYYYRGLILLGTGRLDEAMTSFDKGLTIDPKKALLYAGQGHARWLQKKEPEAAALFDKAMLMSKKKNVEVLQAVARAYLSDRARAGDAVALLQQAKALEPKNPETYMLLGDAFFAQEKGGPAASNYEWAAQYNPRMAAPHYKLGILYLLTRDTRMAEESFLKAAAIDSTYAPAYREVAEIHYQRKDGAGAVKYFEQYLRRIERNDKDQTRYAFFLFMAREFTKANAVFREVTQGEGVNPMTLRYYGYSLNEAGEWAESQKAFQRYFAATPQADAADYAYYGKLLIKLNEDSVAVANLGRSLDLNKQQPDVTRLLAETQLKRRKYPEAAEAYRQVFATSRPQSQDYYSYGRACYFSQQFAQADTTFKRLIALQPAMAVGYLWEARTQSSLDPESEKGLAKPYYEKVIELSLPTADRSKNELIEAYSYLGYFHYLKKEFATSRSFWKKVQALDPGNEKAKEALRALK